MDNNVPWWGRIKDLGIRVKKKNKQDFYSSKIITTCNYFRNGLLHKVHGAKKQYIIL